jgi:fibro-slime domain-containing protein
MKKLSSCLVAAGAAVLIGLLGQACADSSGGPDGKGAPPGGLAGAPGSGGMVTGGPGAGGTGTGPIIIIPEGGAAGMSCPTQDCGPVDVKDPICADGILDPGEACDDGNDQSGDGCEGNCMAVEKDFACPIPNQPCVSTVSCGDRKITGSETCDDGNQAPGDGCSAVCQLDAGWACPVTGARCVASQCGDGIVAGLEECDDGNPNSSDGCSASCAIEPGYKCDTPNAPCQRTTCGDNVREGIEQCDDGNFNGGDGCSPLCQLEPVCVNGVCEARCGDGIKLPSEECDDGNTRDFDGCSSTCKIEPGFSCEVLVLPPKLPIVLRDFVGTRETGSNQALQGNTGPVHRDFEKYVDCAQDIMPTLDADKKPVLKTRNSPSRDSGNCVESAATFAQWYRSDSTINRTVVDELTFLPTNPNDPNPTAFVFEDTSFFPLDGRGWNDPADLKEQLRGGHNFHFTSELRYWFTYKGGERLTFFGDDDVWVFINGKMAVDIAGLHSRLERSITLGVPGATDGDEDTFGYPNADDLGLTVGGIYEVIVFQAERHQTESQYKLTLENFLSARSVCRSVCGDGPANDGRYNGCTAQCTFGPRCGDGTLQAANGEECDDGVNLTAYASSPTSLACAPECKKPSYCGDAIVDSLFGEQCDDGLNTGAYGKCAPGCVIGPRCGDRIVQAEAGEQCDDGNRVPGEGCSASCQREEVK